LRASERGMSPRENAETKGPRLLAIERRREAVAALAKGGDSQAAISRRRLSLLRRYRAGMATVGVPSIRARLVTICLI
jgi:hypothetical protein